MLIFRTQASPKIGFGRLKRSTYLASLLKKHHHILFYINDDKTALTYLKSKNFQYYLSKELDNRRQKSIKSIIFDIKSFCKEDLNFIQWARKNNLCTIQFIETGENRYDIDYTIKPSIEKFPHEDKAQVLSGPDFCILHNSFRHFNKIKRKYREKIKNILLCLGGSTEYRKLRDVIDFLNRYPFNLKIAPGFYLKKSSKKILKRIYPPIRFVGKTESLARSLFEADIAIIPSGILAFEAASIGTPALYIFHNKKQESAAGTFEREGTGLKTSNIDGLSNSDIINKIIELSLEQRAEMGRRGKILVDGMGAYRIIDFFKNKGII